MWKKERTNERKNERTKPPAAAVWMRMSTWLRTSWHISYEREGRRFEGERDNERVQSERTRNNGKRKPFVLSLLGEQPKVGSRKKKVGKRKETKVTKKEERQVWKRKMRKSSCYTKIPLAYTLRMSS